MSENIVQAWCASGLTNDELLVSSVRMEGSILVVVVAMPIADAMVERACRAIWRGWDNGHKPPAFKRQMRGLIRQGLEAALNTTTPAGA